VGPAHRRIPIQAASRATSLPGPDHRQAAQRMTVPRTLAHPATARAAATAATAAPRAPKADAEIAAAAPPQALTMAPRRTDQAKAVPVRRVVPAATVARRAVAKALAVRSPAGMAPAQVRGTPAAAAVGADLRAARVPVAPRVAVKAPAAPGPAAMEAIPSPATAVAADRLALTAIAANHPVARARARAADASNYRNAMRLAGWGWQSAGPFLRVTDEIGSPASIDLGVDGGCLTVRQ